MCIGSRIKKRREALNITQEELAHSLGYKSKSSINKIEKGLTDLNQNKVMEIAKILRTSPTYLLGVDDNEHNNDVLYDYKFKDGTSFTILTDNKDFVEAVKTWAKEISMEDLTQDEFVEIINYAKYLKSKRKWR